MLPNFFVVGANKAGTTSLAAYLDEHPDVFMSPVKEPSFWSYRADRDHGAPFLGLQVRDRAAYEALFAAVRNERAIGEASTNYLQTAQAADRIRAEIPEARIVAVLRDPSSRAFSAYNMHVGANLEPHRGLGTRHPGHGDVGGHREVAARGLVGGDVAVAARRPGERPVGGEAGRGAHPDPRVGQAARRGIERPRTTDERPVARGAARVPTVAAARHRHTDHHGRDGHRRDHGPGATGGHRVM